MASAIAARGAGAPVFVAPPNLIPAAAGTSLTDIDDEEFEL
jgi:hypothetical protein